MFSLANTVLHYNIHILCVKFEIGDTKLTRFLAFSHDFAWSCVRIFPSHLHGSEFWKRLAARSYLPSTLVQADSYPRRADSQLARFYRVRIGAKSDLKTNLSQNRSPGWSKARPALRSRCSPPSPGLRYNPRALSKPHAACGAPRTPWRRRRLLAAGCWLLAAAADARTRTSPSARLWFLFFPLKTRKNLPGDATKRAEPHRNLTESTSIPVPTPTAEHQPRRKVGRNARDVCPRRMRRAAVATTTTTTRMAAEEMRRASASTATAEMPASPAPAQAGSRWARVWPRALRWIPTSTDRIIAAEKRLLTIVKYNLAPCSI